jgi:poly-gamma-glutamate synthesis protein (capsule biosynthesis protein)
MTNRYKLATIFGSTALICAGILWRQVMTRQIPPRRPSAAIAPQRPNPAPVDFTLDFAGDCTFGTVNGDGGPGRFPYVYSHSREKDYPFHRVHRWFDHDDLTVVNFECTLTDRVATADKQWHFKGPAGYASIFPAGGVDVVGLANNHSHDYLQRGFDDTVANFRRTRVPAFYQDHPYITTIKGVQVVLIGDCTVVGENTTVIDDVPNRVVSEIKRYKRPDNIVIIFIHWGSELDTTPRSWQQAMGRQFIDTGADSVIGAHPHVVQGIERYKGKYIAYSLGNFAFGGNSLAGHPETFILRLKCHAEHGQTAVTEASIVPCLITSTTATNDSGVLINNYQPHPLTGPAAARVTNLVQDRNAVLPGGLRSVACVDSK